MHCFFYMRLLILGFASDLIAGQIPSVVTALGNTGEHNFLINALTLLDEEGLGDGLTGDGLTLFCPDDKAWKKYMKKSLPDLGLSEDLLFKDADRNETLGTLIWLLQYHTLPTVMRLERSEEQEIVATTSLDDHSLIIHILGDNKVTLSGASNTANVEELNLPQSGGSAIHLIDQILLPPGVYDPGSIYQDADLCKKIDASLLPPSLAELPESDIRVGAYYYPWHSDDFHRGQGYLREKIEQCPLLGEYDDREKQTISKHLAWSRQANIRLWVTSWWGPDSREEETLQGSILNHEELGDHSIALFYETTGRVKEERRDLEYQLRQNSSRALKKSRYSLDNVKPDIEYICKNYFNHPNYLRVNDKPVLFLYLTRRYESAGVLEELIGLMREAKCDQELYLVGDHAFRYPEAYIVEGDYPPFDVLDAITNYDVYGSIGVKDIYAGNEEVQEHYEWQSQWKELAKQQGCDFIPSVTPGYNDLGVRPQMEKMPMSRRLNADSAPGSLFGFSLEHAIPLVDPDAGQILMVNSFNEWHEDTQIEPAVGEGTSLPAELTRGLDYEGYGDLYLNILRNYTSETPSQSPSAMPSKAPSKSSALPSAMPSQTPSKSEPPSETPSQSEPPSAMPSQAPSKSSALPSSIPPQTPSSSSARPLSVDSQARLSMPSSAPSQTPLVDSQLPSALPSSEPSHAPSNSKEPSGTPSSPQAPSVSATPSVLPSAMPSQTPSKSEPPSETPSQ
jgi:glycoprotein endo-alpha-1,2-mannosidase